MPLTLQQLLRKHGPMPSSLLAELLVQEGVTPVAARQRIARRGKGIHSLAGLPLAHNARFIYLAEQYGSPGFWSALIRCLESVPGAYGRALAAVRARGGMMPRRHFTIASGSPVRMARRMAADAVSDRLVAAGLLKYVEVVGFGPCVALSKDLSYLETPASDMQARVITERVLLEAIKTWGRNLAIGSFNKFALRDADENQPRVGAFEFDLAAPSYVMGLAIRIPKQHPKPGFFICDVLLNGEISLEGIQPFIQKCATLVLAKNMPRCLPIFVADRYSSDALAAARTAGIVPATPEALFGLDVSKALKELTNTLKAAADRALDPERFGRMFAALSAFEGVAGTLRGALFEFVANHLAHKALHARTSMNRKLREGGQDVAEIDVIAIVEDQRVHFIECKGIAPESFVDAAEVTRWIEKRIPAIRRWALKNEELRELPMTFELWSTGKLMPESQMAIEGARQATRKYQVVWRGPAELEALTKATRDKALLKVLRQHFIRSPLA